VGARAAQGKYLVFLDDDDTLVPEMVETSLAALNRERETGEHGLPEPIAVLTGLRIVNEQGDEQEVHLPLTLPRGKHYSLEDPVPGTSPFCKQTLFIEREVFLGMGGFDPEFRSRQQSEMFFRLNKVCSLLGVPVVTYNWMFHDAARITRDPTRRQKGFYSLVSKYQYLFDAHPKRYSWYLRDHAYRSFLDRQYWPAVVAYFRATRQDPWASLAWLAKGFPNETEPENMP
jgi:GT2 family glycosyltransferase